MPSTIVGSDVTIAFSSSYLVSSIGDKLKAK